MTNANDATSIHEATPEDFGALLALNAASVHFLSPLDAARLRQLHDEAAYHRVVVVDGCVAAFLLAFREGATYDSPNYTWFAARYPRFLYIDRIVVDAKQRGRQLGARLYDDVIAFALASGVSDITCEFDVEPPNPASQRFHERFGFVEVGRQTVANGTKVVSLRALRVEPKAQNL